MATILEQIRQSRDAILVPMNEVESCRWSSDPRYLATEGLNGCTAVVIYSKYAGVLAHIAPRTETATGDEDVRTLLQRVVQLYNAGKQHNLFPPATSVVLAAVYQGNVALPEAVDIIKRVIESLDILIVYREYRVREQTQARTRGETSIVVRGQAGQDPDIYINNQPLDAAWSGRGEIEESTNTQEPEEQPEEEEDEDDNDDHERSAEMDQQRRVLATRIQQARQRRDQLMSSGYNLDQTLITLVPVMQESLGISREQAVRILETGLPVLR